MRSRRRDARLRCSSLLNKKKNVQRVELYDAILHDAAARARDKEYNFVE